jgi:hypothetical protein
MEQNHTRKVNKHLEGGGHRGHSLGGGGGKYKNPEKRRKPPKSNDWIYHNRPLPNIYLRFLYDHPPIVLLYWTVFTNF